MKIIQLLTRMAFGDAIGNDTLAIRDFIREKGYETAIYAESIDARLPAGTALLCYRMPPLEKEDILLYHASTSTPLNTDLLSYGGKKAMIYHNITPPKFFSGYSTTAKINSRWGELQIAYASRNINYCIADSEFNKQQLIAMGCQCPIDVCPILIPFEDYDKAPDEKLLKKYRGDGWTNLLFVGRIAPNKCQQDVIRAFYVYQKRYNPKSRLFLVGNGKGEMEVYEGQLRDYAKQLGIADKVIFPGHIKFNAILAYYRLADVFVCMSEHEGFCVPIVEAMHFRKPIVAYASTAIPETLGKGGLLLDTKDPELAAGAINRVLEDSNLKKYLLSRQEEELKRFQYEAVKERFWECLQRVL